MKTEMGKLEMLWCLLTEDIWLKKENVTAKCWIFFLNLEMGGELSKQVEGSQPEQWRFEGWNIRWDWYGT